MQMHATLILSGLVFSSTAWAQQPAPAIPQPTVQVSAEVDGLLRAYEKAWEARDIAALAALFAPEGMALPNGSLPAKGAEAIAAAYAKSAGSPLHLRPIAFEQGHDLAIVIGTFGPAPGKGEFGKFVLVLRQTAAGSWRIVADMDNMNFMPKPPPAAPSAVQP